MQSLFGRRLATRRLSHFLRFGIDFGRSPKDADSLESGFLSGFWIVAEKSNFVELSHWRGFGEIAARGGFLGIGLFGAFLGLLWRILGKWGDFGERTETIWRSRAPDGYGVLEY